MKPEVIVMDRTLYQQSSKRNFWCSERSMWWSCEKWFTWESFLVSASRWRGKSSGKFNKLWGQSMWKVECFRDLPICCGATVEAGVGIIKGNSVSSKEVSLGGARVPSWVRLNFSTYADHRFQSKFIYPDQALWPVISNTETPLPWIQHVRTKSKRGPSLCFLTAQMSLKLANEVCPFVIYSLRKHKKWSVNLCGLTIMIIWILA